MQQIVLDTNNPGAADVTVRMEIKVMPGKLAEGALRPVCHV